MKPLAKAAYAGRGTDHVRFDLDHGWQCRVYLLHEDLGRVVLLRHDALKEPRTWMVTADGVDVPWEGRDRLDVTALASTAFDVAVDAGGVRLSLGRLAADVALDPFGIAWSQDGQRFAEDRRTYAYAFSERDGVLHHFAARDLTDQYFGLGDKMR